MSFWQHQTDKPLFPDVIWSRPETTHGAGKLLMIGGSAGNMAHLATLHAQAELSGAGTIHLLVPDSLAKVTKQIPFIQYGPSNPSGGFAKTALDEFIDASQSVDGVLLGGDLGKNSETSVLLESFINKYSGLLIIDYKSVSSFSCGYKPLLARPKTILNVNHVQLREMVIELKLEQAITSNLPRPEYAQILSDISKSYPATLVVNQDNTVWVASNGNVTDTQQDEFLSAKIAVWALQQPNKQYQAIVSALYKLKVV